ncbi:hypothetical protein ABEX29_02725 [Brevibacillus porteri]|uniref:hypothetical protein n=1 Tax=Brevibacillus porteri TaxID=2126350 RepID=UPI003D20EE06
MKQINDWLVMTSYIGYTFILTLLTTGVLVISGVFYFEFNMFSLIFKIGSSIILSLAIGYYLLFKYLKQKWPLPDSNSVYNPFTNVVELHLGGSGDFASSKAVIAVAKSMNKNVYFVTDHLKEETLKRILRKEGYKVEVMEATILQKILYVPLSRTFKLLKRSKIRGYKCIQCLVYTT